MRKLLKIEIVKLVAVFCLGLMAGYQIAAISPAVQPDLSTVAQMGE